MNTALADATDAFIPLKLLPCLLCRIEAKGGLLVILIVLDWTDVVWLIVDIPWRLLLCEDLLSQGLIFLLL